MTNYLFSALTVSSSIPLTHAQRVCVCVCVFDTIGPVSPHPQQQKIKERLFTFFRKPAVSFHPLLLLSSDRKSVV